MEGQNYSIPIRKIRYACFMYCLSFIYLLSGYSQLTLDAGKDTTFCVSLESDTMYIGTNLSIVNGSPPCSFAWECKVPKGLYSFYTASDLLNDTTLRSPYIIFGPTITDSIMFHLYLSDNSNDTISDSLLVRFSQCICPLGYTVFRLNQGDSLWLDAGIPDGKYVKYYYEPSYGLSDPDSSATWCKPDTTTDYNIVTVDSFGCVCSCHSYKIQVIPVSTIEMNENIEDSFYPSVIGSSVVFRNNAGKEALVSVFSTDGKLLHTSSTYQDKIELSKFNLGKGLFIILISIDNKHDYCMYLNNNL
jgi:hypothetical protein